MYVIVWFYTPYGYYFIHDPFNYDTHNDIVQPKEHVALTHWKCLLSFCNQFSIVLPTLSTLKAIKSSLKKRETIPMVIL